MLLCSQRPGNIMAHAHHIPALIVQAQNRRFIPPALCVQRRSLFLCVSDAPGLFAVPQLKPGAQYGFLILAAVFSGWQRWHHTGFAVHPLALAIPRSKTVQTGADRRTVNGVQRIADIFFPAFPVASGGISPVDCVSLKAYHRSGVFACSTSTAFSTGGRAFPLRSALRRIP